MDRSSKDIEVTKPKKKNKKLIIIIVAVIALLVLAGGLIIYSLVTDTSFGDMLAYFEPEVTEETMVLDEFLVNVASHQGSTDQLLRINLAIKYLDADNTEKIRAAVPMMRDIVLSNLRDLKIEIIHQDETIRTFKESTRESLNQHFGEEIVTEVYVTDMIVR